MKIKIAEPNTTQKEIDYVVGTLLRNELSGRSNSVLEFEKAFANYVGVKYAVTCNSGSSALFLALKALKLTGEVIIPTFAYTAVVNEVLNAGLTPVFADSNVNDPNIDVFDVENNIGPFTSAIIAVDTYGIPCAPEIARIAEENDLILIEDLAEALGKKGIIGKVACYSLFANKTITAGEGGIVVTNDEEIYKELLKLTQRIGKAPFPYATYSLRLSGLQAAYANAQLTRIDELRQKKQSLLKMYQELPLKFFTRGEQWMIAALADSEYERDRIIRELEKNDIETRKFFPPLHTQKMYRNGREYPRAEMYASCGLCLPSGTGLKVEDINKVIQIIK